LSTYILSKPYLWVEEKVDGGYMWRWLVIKVEVKVVG
jgi:hypothetical protein